MSVKLTLNQTQENIQPQSLPPTSHNSERWKENNHRIYNRKTAYLYAEYQLLKFSLKRSFLKINTFKSYTLVRQALIQPKDLPIAQNNVTNYSY